MVSSLAMISVSGPTYWTGRGSPCTTADAVASAEPAWKGGSPSVAKYSSAPSDHRSVGGPTSAPWACSGDMYDGDPTIIPVAVSRESSRIVATPKSVSLARSPACTITLAGLTSRWTTPTTWAASSAVRTSSPIRAALGCGIGPPSTTTWARLGASTSSITSQIDPASSTTSNTVTTRGLWSRAAACASRRARRRTRSTSSWPATNSTCLTATRRSSRVSIARNTVDLPRPSGAPSR